MIFNSKGSMRPIPNVTVYEYLFTDNNNIKDEQTCYVDSEDPSQAITFGELKSLILKFGVGLKQNYPDFKQGDVIAIYSPNNIYYPSIAHGIVAAGGSTATIDHNADAEIAADCLQTVEAKLIIAHPDTLARAQEAAKIVGIPEKNVLAIGQSVQDTFWNHQELISPVTYTEKELTEFPCFFYFTSGTTGKKKAAAVTHKMIIACMANSIIEIPPNLITLCHTELHHASTLVGALHFSIKFGYITYIMKNFSFDAFFSAMEKYKVKFMNLQPWILAYMVKEKALTSKYDLSSLALATSSGSSATKETYLTFFQMFNVPVVNIYAMTEVIGCFSTDPQRTFEGSIGSLAPGYTAKIVDNDGKELGYDEAGELCIKGPTVTSGYRNNPEENLKAFDSDGFLHTGDLFKANENGYFTFIDRMKNIFKYRFTTVVPQDIETVLNTHPAVIECSAVGVFDPVDNIWVPRAFVSLMKGTEDIEKVKTELLEIAQTKLTDAQQLRGGLHVIEKLPINSTGKTDRIALRQYEVTAIV